MSLSTRLQPIPISYHITAHLSTQITGDKSYIIFKAPLACQVVDAGFVVNRTEVAKSATNHCVIRLYNGGAAGAGTSNIGNVVLGSASTVAANTINALTKTSTAAYTKLDAGDYLVVKYDEVGTLTPNEFNGVCFIVYGHES